MSRRESAIDDAERSAGTPLGRRCHFQQQQQQQWVHPVDAAHLVGPSLSRCEVDRAVVDENGAACCRRRRWTMQLALVLADWRRENAPWSGSCWGCWPPPSCSLLCVRQSQLLQQSVSYFLTSLSCRRSCVLCRLTLVQRRMIWRLLGGRNGGLAW